MPHTPSDTFCYIKKDINYQLAYNFIIFTIISTNLGTIIFNIKRSIIIRFENYECLNPTRLTQIN
jgi:hypothetical protein